LLLEGYRLFRDTNL